MGSSQPKPTKKKEQMSIAKRARELPDLEAAETEKGEREAGSRSTAGSLPRCRERAAGGREGERARAPATAGRFPAATRTEAPAMAKHVFLTGPPGNPTRRERRGRKEGGRPCLGSGPVLRGSRKGRRRQSSAETRPPLPPPPPGQKAEPCLGPFLPARGELTSE